MKLPDLWTLHAIEQANESEKSQQATTFDVHEGDPVLCTTCGRGFEWQDPPRFLRASGGCVVLMLGVGLIIIGALTLAGGIGIIPMLLGMICVWIAKHAAKGLGQVTCRHCGANGGFLPGDSPAAEAIRRQINESQVTD